MRIIPQWKKMHVKGETEDEQGDRNIVATTAMAMELLSPVLVVAKFLSHHLARECPTEQEDSQWDVVDPRSPMKVL